MGGDFDLIKKMLQQGELTAKDIRFFIGYRGWSPSQLDHEIQSRSWFVCKGHRADIMRTDEDNDVFWKRLVHELGEGYAHIANAPSDPSLN